MFRKIFREMFGGKREIMFKVDVCIEEDGNEYHAYCPTLKGVHIDGKTKEEALENIKIAIALYLRSLIKHDDPIPIRMVAMEDVEQIISCESSTVCPPQQKHTTDIHVTV